MQFRRSGQRDERRRRVLIDEGTGDSGQTATSRPSSGDQSGYTAAARVENQPRLTDLIPQRLRTWLLLVLLAGSAIYGLQKGSVQPSLTSESPVVNSFNCFSLEGPGTLAAWFSSGFLLVAAAGCGMVYLLRRHKVDDYRGHYRLWLWVSAWCVVASLETATEIHRSLETLVAALPVTVSGEEFHFGWLIAVSLAGLILGVRIMIEVRDSYWTNCFWLPAVGAYSAVMLLAFDVSWIETIVVYPLTDGLLLMIGHTALAGMVWMEARHVYRDAQGINLVKKVKPAAGDESLAATPGEVDGWKDSEGTFEADDALDDETVSAEDEEAWDETSEWEEDNLQVKSVPNKLTRAERKRARRQRRKERRQQAA